MNQANGCRPCFDCMQGDVALGRRDFLKGATAMTAAAGGMLFNTHMAVARPTPTSAAETTVKALYEMLTPGQKELMCFDWDYVHPQRGLLRTHISNNWRITRPTIASDFYSKDQQALIREVYKGIFNPDWVERIDKQLSDDSYGAPWGAAQTIAIFGHPGDREKFMFVMTGRHLTCRADGGCTDHVAFGGPICNGHDATDDTETVHHPGNVFWHQAILANQVYKILDGKQQKIALQSEQPFEAAVGFRSLQTEIDNATFDGDRHSRAVQRVRSLDDADAKVEIPGLPCSEMTKDQKFAVEDVLRSLLAPYRKEDVDEVSRCLAKMGGLDKCHLAFYKEPNLGPDEWDNWRLEGPSFVWYFRGHPHVHIWINIADTTDVPLNAGMGGKILPPVTPQKLHDRRPSR
ncbi:MAG: DUF3500 domain-containing protein [Planctomycetaceae bacterium]